MEICFKETLMPETQLKLMQELELLKDLSHPNIIKLFEAYQDDKKLYIITELCSGGELFDKIQDQSSFTELEVASIMDQLMRGISYCHGLDVQHNDLKPENILLERINRYNHVKIINFQKNIDLFQVDKKDFASAFYVSPEAILQGEYS